MPCCPWRSSEAGSSVRLAAPARRPSAGGWSRRWPPRCRQSAIGGLIGGRRCTSLRSTSGCARPFATGPQRPSPPMIQSWHGSAGSSRAPPCAPRTLVSSCRQSSRAMSYLQIRWRLDSWCSSRSTSPLWVRGSAPSMQESACPSCCHRASGPWASAATWSRSSMRPMSRSFCLRSI